MPPKPPPGALKALRTVAMETLKRPLPQLETEWAALTFNCLQRANEALTDGKSMDVRNYTWAGAVGQDKVFIFNGMPTQTVEHLHEYRHQVPDVLEKLLVAARVLERHQRKGYADPSLNVIDVTKQLQSALPIAAPGMQLSDDATGNG